MERVRKYSTKNQILSNIPCLRKQINKHHGRSGGPFEMRKTKVDHTVEGIYIVSSNISEDTAYIHQGVTRCGFRLQ